MLIVCAWCQKEGIRKILGESEPLESKAESHGICERHYHAMMKEIDTMPPQDNPKSKRVLECLICGMRTTGKTLQHTADCSLGKFAKEHPKSKRNPARGWDVTVGSKSLPRVMSRVLANGIQQIIQKEARKWRLLQIDRANLQTEFISKGEFDTLQDAQVHAETFNRNPGAAYHEAEAEQEEQTEQRARRAGKTQQAAFHRGKASAHRQSEAKARTLGMNPGGKRYSAMIEGVIYNRVVEIKAQKTKWQKGFWKHPFAASSGAQILGLDNGDLLIHSTSGKPLWGKNGDV